MVFIALRHGIKESYIRLSALESATVAPVICPSVCRLKWSFPSNNTGAEWCNMRQSCVEVQSRPYSIDKMSRHGGGEAGATMYCPGWQRIAKSSTAPVRPHPTRSSVPFRRPTPVFSYPNISSGLWRILLQPGRRLQTQSQLEKIFLQLGTARRHHLSIWNIYWNYISQHNFIDEGYDRWLLCIRYCLMPN